MIFSWDQDDHALSCVFKLASPKGSVVYCWQKRGCDEEMASRCPHAISSTDGLCAATCYHANCGLQQRKHASSLDILLDPTVDRSAALKEPCTSCEFFLLNGPRLA